MPVQEEPAGSAGAKDKFELFLAGLILAFCNLGVIFVCCPERTIEGMAAKKIYSHKLGPKV